MHLDRLAHDPVPAEVGHDFGIRGEADQLADPGRFLFVVAGEAQEVAGLVFVIEREVGVFLEDTDFANAVLADPAGGEVGDAAGFEMEADVGDVLAAAEDRNSDRVHARDRRADEVQDDFDVVDHQVQYDPDVGAAVRVWREAGNLEEARVFQLGFERVKDRVEAFDMADLEDAAFRGGELRELTRVGGRVGDRLFDEEVLALREEGFADLVMGGCRGADRGGIDQRGEFLERGRGFGVVFRSHGMGGLAVGVEDRSKRRPVDLAVNPRVVDAHMADSDHACFDVCHSP